MGNEPGRGINVQTATTFKLNHYRPISDRVFWMLLANVWRDWRTALIIVHPDTLVRWHRQWLRRRWQRRTFLTNHVAALGSIDFFTVPTVTGRVLFVFVV